MCICTYTGQIKQNYEKCQHEHTLNPKPNGMYLTFNHNANRLIKLSSSLIIYIINNFYDYN